MKKQQFQFDLSTGAGRKKAVEEFCHAINDAISEHKLENKEESCIIIYKDGEHTLGTQVGVAGELAELQAKLLTQHPSLIEPTLKMLPIMLLMKQEACKGCDDDDE